jgi:hypothetical protein
VGPVTMSNKRLMRLFSAEGVAVSDRILDLAKKTNRYRVCDCGLGVFEASDQRCLLDALLQWQAVLPFSEETGLSDFEELCEQQSEGPTLTKPIRTCCYG